MSVLGLIFYGDRGGRFDQDRLRGIVGTKHGRYLIFVGKFRCKEKGEVL